MYHSDPMGGLSRLRAALALLLVCACSGHQRTTAPPATPTPASPKPSVVVTETPLLDEPAVVQPVPPPPVAAPPVAPAPVAAPMPAPAAPPPPPPAPARPPPAVAGVVAGVIDLLAGTVRSPAAQAVVWLPGVPSTEGEPPPELASEGKRFAPHVLAVPVGATVDFPNRDSIYHNVFSTTPGRSFDLGLYRAGASRQYRFNAAGLVHIYCNIHAQMAAFVRVVDGAWTLTREDGSFRIENVPAGARQVSIWHERGGERELTTFVRGGKVADIRVVLDASEFKPASHKNKHGQEYPPATLDDDRY